MSDPNELSRRHGRFGRLLRRVAALWLALSCCACSDDDDNAPGAGGVDAAGGAAGSHAGVTGSGGSTTAGSGGGANAGSGGANAGGKAGGSAGGGGSTSTSGGSGSSGGGTGGSSGGGDPTLALAAGNAYCEKIDAEDCASLTTLEQCKAVLNRYVGESQACLDATQAYWECALAAPDVCNVNAACDAEGDMSNELCF